MAENTTESESNGAKCAELPRCPFPDLVAYLRELTLQEFQGSLHLSFEKGRLDKIKREEDVEFVRP